MRGSGAFPLLGQEPKVIVLRNVSMIFHRVPEGWKIVHDHTSVASVPQPAASAVPETKKKK
jgi:hypothetical protein